MVSAAAASLRFHQHEYIFKAGSSPVSGQFYALDKNSVCIIIVKLFVELFSN
jgi:hypothetical protein